jgi:signal recognition particle GTPase
MSLDIIEKQIQNFLKSNEPEVMAIKGVSGVGKTYTWNKFLEQAKQSDAIPLASI